MWRKVSVREAMKRTLSLAFEGGERESVALAHHGRLARVRSEGFQALDDFDRDELVDSRGNTFKNLKRCLTPRWGVVWRDLSLGHLALWAGVAVLTMAERWLPTPYADDSVRPLAVVAILAAVVAGAIYVGLVVAYVQLFFHEAAHFLLAPSRVVNDRLANLTIGLLSGQEISFYRKVHFDHHRFLGTARDTERTYFDPLDVRFLVEALTGFKILKVLGVRQRLARAALPKRGGRQPGLLNAQLWVGAALHASLLLLALVTGHWLLFMAWLLGMGVMFPFFAAVRQVLEHRSTEAGSDPAYYLSERGRVPTTRLFVDGMVTRVLGGAGFSRHLLHHWEPQISYTRLAELETFLRDSAARPALSASSATYASTLLALLRSDARRT
jgi:fatty acid desaturase